MSFPLIDFIKLCEKQGKSQAYIEETTTYIKKLQSSNLPVIFSLEHLSIMMGIQSTFLRVLIKDYKYRKEDEFEEGLSLNYKYFKLKKKNGEFREIMVPSKNLKYIQKWILINILEKNKLSNKCTGFRKGYSIYNNAVIHENADLILKIDLLKFYDNITFKRVYGLFNSMGYHSNLCVSFAKICTSKHNYEYWNSFKENHKIILKDIIEDNEPILPQGAPTSPMIANLILRKLDYRFEKLSEKLGFKYSRYADDLTFSIKSSAKLPSLKLIEKIINDENFYINYEKIKYRKKGQSQYVTGLSIDNGIHTKKKYRKLINRHIYFCNKYGVKSHLKKIKYKKGFLFYENSMRYHDWLYGHICFISSIDGEYGSKLLNEFNKIFWEI